MNYNKPENIKRVLNKIRELSERLPFESVSFMEVCGTHTMAISKAGIREVLPSNIKLISGPGCPVCVTSPGDIDTMIEIADFSDVIVTTFGDMVRVPGSRQNNLSAKKADGADIRIVYSPAEILDIARNNPEKKIVFLSVGFETTAPTIASTLLEAERQTIDNIMIFPANKVIPPAMKALVMDRDVAVHGFICPGHVSVIIGAKPYEFLAKDYGIPCVIAGFEPADVIFSVYKLLLQVVEKRAEVEVQYSRWVRPEGNKKALQIVYEIFQETDSRWRGIGVIPLTGLTLKPEFSGRNALEVLGLSVPDIPEPPGCRCGEVLKGIIKPYECGLFKTACTPFNPVGPCMVSSEGSCAIYYKYT